MSSFYKEGDKVQFEGFRGTVTQITETYRKNVLVVDISAVPSYCKHNPTTLGLFEYPDGRLEFMNFIS